MSQFTESQGSAGEDERKMMKAAVAVAIRQERKTALAAVAAVEARAAAAQAETERLKELLRMQLGVGPGGSGLATLLRAIQEQQAGSKFGGAEELSVDDILTNADPAEQFVRQVRCVQAVREFASSLLSKGGSGGPAQAASLPSPRPPPSDVIDYALELVTTTVDGGGGVRHAAAFLDGAMRYLLSCNAPDQAIASMADRLADAVAMYGVRGNAGGCAAAVSPDCRKLARGALERLGKLPGGSGLRAALSACAKKLRGIAERLSDRSAFGALSASYGGGATAAAGGAEGSLTLNESGPTSSANTAGGGARPAPPASLAEEDADAQYYDNASHLLRALEALLDRAAAPQRGPAGPLAPGGGGAGGAAALGALEEFAGVHSGSMRCCRALEQRGWALLAAHIQRLTAAANKAYSQLYSAAPAAAAAAVVREGRVR